MKYPLKATLSGDVSIYVPQDATGHREGLQVSIDMWDDGEEPECQEVGDLEGRRFPDSSGR